MDFIYFNFDLSIVSLFIGILNDKKKKKKKEWHVVFSLLFYLSHPKIPTHGNHKCPRIALYAHNP